MHILPHAVVHFMLAQGAFALEAHPRHQPL